MSSRIIINGKEVKNPIVKSTLSVVLLILILLLVLVAAILLLPLIGLGIGIGLGAGLIGLGTLAVRYKIARHRFATKLREQSDNEVLGALPHSSRDQDQ